MFGHSRRKRARKLRREQRAQEAVNRTLEEIRGNQYDIPTQAAQRMNPDKNSFEYQAKRAWMSHGERKRERKALRQQKTATTADNTLREIRGTDTQMPMQSHQAQEREQDEQTRTRAMQNAALTQASRRQAEQEGREDAQKFLMGTSVRGLDPAQRSAMQHEAERSIDRQEQLNMRELLGEHNRRGIVGKGGVGFAQQRNLQNLGQEERGRVQRDLTRLDKDLELKNKAAIFAAGKGESGQHLLDQQTALDELRLEEEKRRQRNIENAYARHYLNVKV